MSAVLLAIAFSLLGMVAVGGCWRRSSATVLFPTVTVAASLLFLAAAAVGPNGAWDLPLPIYLADASFGLVLDPLSRWFVGVVGLVGIPVCVFAPGYFEYYRQRISLGFVWAGLAVLLASMVGVVLAANAIAFLVAWEVMAFSSFALVATDHKQRSIRHAALVYLGATRVGTAFLMAGFLWAHALTGTWTFADWHLYGPTAIGPALLVGIGLATKAGCWPFHLWLPIAHPAAPAPISALMSGVMIKTAIYAMVRLLVLGNHLDAPYAGVAILVLGSISAFWGIIFALLQKDLKRLLAYSSVENIGIVLLAIGVARLGQENGLTAIFQLGLAAALFHSLNHAIFKTLVFLGTGAIDSQTHSRNAEEMGGLLRRMPWTGATFIVGSAALCALPPLNGFAGEWLLYKGLFGLASDGPSMGWRLTGLLLMGWLGLVGALAVACFVKAAGVVFLGAPRTSRARNAQEAAPAMTVPLAILAALCVGIGLSVPAALALLQPIVVPAGSPTILATEWSVPMVGISAVLLLTIGGIGLYASRQAREHPGRTFVTWECGFGTLGPRTQYTATSFAQPISRIFGAIYRYGIQINVGSRHREHFPRAVRVETHHEPYLETRVYRPLLKGVRRTAGGLIMRLQAGSIHQYLVYMFAVLVLLLTIGVLWK